MKTKEQFDSFWIPEPFSGCHLWSGAVSDQKSRWAYGELKWKGKKTKAHRMSWVLTHGEIPKGAWVLHRCDTPLCVNPDHLFLGNKEINRADCIAKGRTNKGVRNHNTKLTPEQVLEIRASPDSWSKLAARFGVGKPTIQGVKQNRWWRHIKSDTPTVINPQGQTPEENWRKNFARWIARKTNKEYMRDRERTEKRLEKLEEKDP